MAEEVAIERRRCLACGKTFDRTNGPDCPDCGSESEFVGRVVELRGHIEGSAELSTKRNRMPKSSYLRDALLNWVRNNASMPAPTGRYVSLHTADPGLTGANEHGATAGYGRTAVEFGAPAGGVVANTAVDEHPQASANYSAPITHFGVWDAAGVGAGNFLAGAVLTTPRTFVASDIPRWPIGALTWTEN